MGCRPLKWTIGVVALIAVAAPGQAFADPDGSSGASSGQKFEYTPYNGQNNTGTANEPPPQDNYTPAHQGSVGSANATSAYSGPSGAAAAPAYQDDARQSNGPDADTNTRAEAHSGDAYSPSRGAASEADTYAPSQGDAYSPPRSQASASPARQGDAFSPSRDGPEPPPPPAAAEGPPVREVGAGLPRIEVQAAAPDDGLPYAVREHDARRAAIEGWHGKVSDRFGPEFSHWRVAVGKHIDCHPDRRDGIICTASAQPARGLDRYGEGPRDDSE